ncbi:hypothetical protein IH992_12095 [Candidatus Poribacteria bacterium]|nr:hypothetical protein [Candidatus Poribacteria bacterium]
MTRRIKTSSKPLPSVRITSWRAPSVNRTMVAKALGAENVSETDIDLEGNPPSLFTLRRELCERLRSTGGRQSLEGATRRQKIPLSDEDWERLQKLAELSQSEGVHPTPGQVASVLLHQALEVLDQMLIS